MKNNITISLNTDLDLSSLKGRVSAICEQALRKKLNQTIIAKEEDILCWSCNKNKPNMIWDGIRECWVCETCNNAVIRNVSVAMKR